MGLIMKNGISYSSSGGGSSTGGCNAVDLTMAEYEALEAEGKVAADTTYYITDESPEGDGPSSNKIKITKLTQAEYDALSENEQENGMYLITDSENITAKNMFYDGSETGLGNTVQDAIDTLANSSNTSGSNPVGISDGTNLLINSNFSNPINQRMFTEGEFTGTGKAYTIDRWYLWNTSSLPCNPKLTVNDGYITLSGTKKTNIQTEAPVWIAQDIENCPEGIYTFSCKINGKVYSCTTSLKYVDDLSIGTTTMLNSDNSIGFIGGGVIGHNDGAMSVGIVIDLNKISSIDIEWVKLEKGEVVTSYIPRTYTEEWLLCQRYFQSLAYDTYIFYIYNVNKVGQNYSIIPMRTNPSVFAGMIQSMQGAANIEDVIIDNYYGINMIYEFTVSAAPPEGNYIVMLQLDAEI